MPYSWGRNDAGDMCVCIPKWKTRCTVQKDKFYNEMIHEWVIKGRKELTLGSGDFKVMLEKRWVDLRVYMEEMKIGEQNSEGRLLLEF